MTVTMELSPEAMRRIEEAREKGVKVETLFSRWLEQLPEEAEMPWGARVIAELQKQGVIGMWQDRPESSDDLADEFRRKAEARRSQCE
jgi:hypothetical protein